jgi:hypothetical protein
LPTTPPPSHIKNEERNVQNFHKKAKLQSEMQWYLFSLDEGRMTTEPLNVKLWQTVWK